MTFWSYTKGMSGKVAAALLVLVLASCFGRVSAWAAAPGDAHACCHGSAPAKGPVLSDCCAVPAVSGEVAVVRGELLAFLAEAPEIPPVVAVHSVPAERPAPPGPQTLRPAVLARAPPLA
jgi:hypothetical protein